MNRCGLVRPFLIYWLQRANGWRMSKACLHRVGDELHTLLEFRVGFSFGPWAPKMEFPLKPGADYSYKRFRKESRVVLMEKFCDL